MKRMMSLKTGNSVFYILFSLFVVWICLGAFPLVCYEADSKEVILGCDILYRHGWSLPPIESYEYRMQPLLTIMIVALKNILPFLNCEQIYCLCTILSGLLFLYGSIILAFLITKESKTRLLVAAMLLPEVYAICMYPNASIIPATCFVYSLILFLHHRNLLAGLLMCVAPLFRVDVVIVYPAIFPLFLYLGYSLRKSLSVSVLYGVVVIIVDLFFFWLMKADVLSAYIGYQGWNWAIQYWQVLFAVFAFYSLPYVILLPLGVYVYFKKKLWKELFLIVMPIVILHFVYRSMGCASKHYLYIVPFVIMLGARSLSWLKAKVAGKPLMKWSVLLLTLALFVFSVRLSPQDRPWYDKDILYNGGMIIPFGSKELSSYKMSVGLGAGQFIRTEDEAMLASGHLFYSWYIHSYKSELADQVSKTKEIVMTSPSANIVTIGFGSWVSLSSSLLSDGFKYKANHGENKDLHAVISNGETTYRIWNMEYEDEGDIQTNFNKLINKLPLQFAGEKTFVLVQIPRFVHYMDELIKDNDRVTKKTKFLYRIDCTP